MTGKLPEADLSMLKISHITYLGTTRPLDPKKFTGLDEPVSHCDTILGTNRAETVTLSPLFFFWMFGFGCPPLPFYLLLTNVVYETCVFVLFLIVEIFHDTKQQDQLENRCTCRG